MSDAFVIADAHGNADLIRDLLEQEGIIEQDTSLVGAYRVMGPDKVTVVQLGDLANCVAKSILADRGALALALNGLIDTVCCGNHEHPYLGGPAFAGYWPDPEVRRDIFSLRDRGILQAAYESDGILVTHAGVPLWVIRELGRELWPNAIAHELNELWKTDPRHRFFSAIGARRSGWSAVGGGILWADWREKKTRGLHQVIGHTVGSRVRAREKTTCIDIGANVKAIRIAGAWIRGGVVEPVIFDRTEVKGES